MPDPILSNSWKLVPGRTKGSLGRIAVAALDRRSDPFDRLVGTLQEKHGWNRERAAKELLRRLAKHRAGRARGGAS